MQTAPFCIQNTLKGVKPYFQGFGNILASLVSLNAGCLKLGCFGRLDEKRLRLPERAQHIPPPLRRIALGAGELNGIALPLTPKAGKTQKVYCMHYICFI